MSSATVQGAKATDALQQHSVSPQFNLKSELSILSLVFIVASWVFFCGLGDVPLFNPDECFYAEPAREMLDTKDFITTTLNYAVRYTKPPLHYWATALCYQLFGANEFAARFFSAACAAALVAATYCLLNKFVSRRAGLFASAILLTAPLYVVTGRLAICEMSLAFFMTGGLFCFFTAFREKRMDLVWLGYVLLALAAMTKGPVGIALPVIILAGYHIMRRNFLSALAFYKPHWGALLAASIALPWYVVETIVTKGEYFTCFIVMENFQRFTNVVSGHKGAWWYHIAVVAAGFFPWTIFLPQALVGALKPAADDAGQSQSSPARTNILNTFRHLDARQDVAFFAGCLAIITIAFYSASVSKLMSYTLPAFPALAMLIAIEIDRAINHAKRNHLLVPLGILATAYGVAALIEPVILKLVHRVPEGISPVVSAYLLAQFAVFAAALALILLKRQTWGAFVMAGATIFTTAFFGYQGVSTYADQRERGLPEIAYFAAQSNEPIFVYKARLPSTTFYTHRPTVFSPAQEKPIAGTNRFTGVAGQSQPPEIKYFHQAKAVTAKPKADDESEVVTPDDVKNAIAARHSAYVISRKADAADFDDMQGYKRVAQRGSFVLIHWSKPASPEP